MLNDKKFDRCCDIVLSAVVKSLTATDKAHLRTMELYKLSDETLDEVEVLIDNYPLPPKIKPGLAKAIEILDGL